ncbi:hypothetical protein Tco_0612321, partial [Tanacetum coccineum]
LLKHINSDTNTLDNQITFSSSSIIVEQDDAPQIVSSSVKQVATEPNSPVLNENIDESVQEDVVDFDGNVFYNPSQTHVFEVAESSSTLSAIRSDVPRYLFREGRVGDDDGDGVS